MNEKITLGRIIWLAGVVDPQGRQAGKHAAIILTTKAEYQAGQPILAVVVSSKLHYGDKEAIVEVPSDPKGHPQTGFDKPSAAICHWTVRVEEEDIVDFGRLIYGDLLAKILTGVAKAGAKSSQS